MASALGISAT